MTHHLADEVVARAELIASTANPRVKSLVALRRRRARDEAQRTLVDGHDEIALAHAAGAMVETLYVSPDLISDHSELALAASLADARTQVVRLSAAAFGKASYRESPDGWLAVVRSPERPLAAIRLPEHPLVLVAESVEKPGNLGAMLRTADAAGVAAAVAAPTGTDWGNPNVVRASKGAVFAVPVASATTDDAVTWVRERGLRTVVATPDSPTSYTDADLTGGLAVVVGAEHEGVGNRWRESAELLVRIPMSGQINSLNVATSAALILFEALRQRTSSSARPAGS